MESPKLNVVVDNVTSSTGTVLMNQVGGLWVPELKAVPAPKELVPYYHSRCEADVCKVYADDTLVATTPYLSQITQPKQEELHMADFVLFGIGCIMIAIACGIAIGTRIVWLQTIGETTYTKVKRTKKAEPLAD
jgi:hypothetical protein